MYKVFDLTIAVYSLPIQTFPLINVTAVFFHFLYQALQSLTQPMCNINKKNKPTTKYVHYKECVTFLAKCVNIQNQHLVLAVAKSEQCVIHLKYVCLCVCVHARVLQI